jgi:Do/DeqQ family serine protease
MSSSFHVRRTTAILTVAIAVLIGALVATVGLTRQAPITVQTAHAAALAEQIPFGSFAPVVKHTAPAVVNISSSKLVKTSNEMPGFFEDPFFRQFFGGRMPRQQQPRSERATSLGSGVIVSPDGYILTNNHVIEGATDVKVSFSDKREFSAKVIGGDKPADIAVLKIDQKNLPTLAWAGSAPQVGDLALAIGNPFGLGQTVTMGIVSATGRSLGGQIEMYEDFIQTDAAINPGNSGGALINSKGELIGINTAILAGNGGGNQGVGFAIPVTLARNIMDQIVKTGKVRRGYIGVTLQGLDPELAKTFGLGNNLHGIAITTVAPDSPGAKAGLQSGDVITAVNGSPVDDPGALRVQVAGMSPGSTIHLKVFRNGSTRDMAVTLGEYPSKLLAGNQDDQGNQPGLNGSGEKGAMKGVSVQTLTPELRQQLEINGNFKGVVVTEVDPESQAAQAGLMQGDVITQVNRKPVNDVGAFNDAVRQGNGSDATLLLVRRGQGSLFLAIPNK